jgi:hypothetical protein
MRAQPPAADRRPVISHGISPSAAPRASLRLVGKAEHIMIIRNNARKFMLFINQLSAQWLAPALNTDVLRPGFERIPTVFAPSCGLLRSVSDERTRPLSPAWRKGPPSRKPLSPRLKFESLRARHFNLNMTGAEVVLPVAASEAQRWSLTTSSLHMMI